MDVVAPTIIRHVYTRGTALAGRLALALVAATLVVQHHRVQVPPDPMLILDLLRAARYAAVDEAGPLECALVASVLSALADMACPLILADSAALAAVLSVCGSVLDSAGGTAQAWWVCEAVTVAARLVCKLVSASAEASAACIESLESLRTRGASHLSGLTRGSSIGGRMVTSSTSLTAMSSAPPPLAMPSSDASLLDVLLDYLIGVLPTSASRSTLGVLRAAEGCLQALAALCSRGDALRQQGFKDADLPRLLTTWIPIEQFTDTLTAGAEPSIVRYSDLVRCAAISCIAELARWRSDARGAALGAGAVSLLMSAIAQPLDAVRPAKSLPHWPGQLTAPAHAAATLLLLIEGSALGEARPTDSHASPVQVKLIVPPPLLPTTHTRNSLNVSHLHLLCRRQYVCYCFEPQTHLRHY